MKIKKIYVKGAAGITEMILPVLDWWEKPGVWITGVATAISIFNVIVKFYPDWNIGMAILTALGTIEQILQVVVAVVPSPDEPQV